MNDRFNACCCGAVHEIKDVLADNKMYLLDQCDAYGRPVFLEVSKNHYRKTCCLKQEKRSLVFLLD